MKLELPYSQKKLSSYCYISQYIGVDIRPDILAPVRLFAPGNGDYSPEELKLRKIVINVLRETKDLVLKYVPL